MQSASQLWLFFLMVFGIIALPGMDMAFVLSHAIASGHQRGLMAVAGIVVGGVCHVLAASLGLSLAMAAAPGLMKVLLFAGSAYLAWIGLSIWRSQGSALQLAQAEPAPPWHVFGQAWLTCLLNPKAYLFMLAVFPQFLHEGQGSVWRQSAVLGLILALTQIGIYGGLCLAAARSRQWLSVKPTGLRLANRAVGALLMLGAAFTTFSGLTKV